MGGGYDDDDDDDDDKWEVYFYHFSKGCNETCAKSETTRGVHSGTKTSLQPGVLNTKQGLSPSPDRVVSQLSYI